MRNDSPRGFSNRVALPQSVQALGLENPRGEAFRIAYISDAHLYEKKLNDRFVKALLRAVDDVNRMDPQPDFVLFGGDLAQLGAAAGLDLGAQMLKKVK